MNYRYRSERCRHGLCLLSVGCEVCGVKADRKASAKLRRASERKVALPRTAEGYGLTETRGRGNNNAGSGKW